MRNVKLVKGLPFDVPEIIDIVDALPKKSTWEALKKQNVVRGVWDGTYSTGFRKPEDIDTIVVHHSGSPEGTLESHARYHASKWGAGIAYHMCIDKGKIFQTNDLLSFTFNVGNNNTYIVGIEVNRDLSKGDLTAEERKLLYAAILTVKSVLPIKHILGHNELNATACPVTNMDTIRRDIINLEHQMEYQQSPNHARETAYAVAEENLYLYNLAQGKDPTGKPVSEGTQQWAIESLLKIAAVMRENKLIK